MKTSIGLALLLGSSALASVAFAQAAPGAVDEIVVTAQNRAQNVQDVPIKIDVVSAEQLAAAGFSDANDLNKIAPVAMIQQDQGSVQVTVRGVGNTAGGSTDNAVVTNIDGEYINTPGALGSAIFDLDRVEVLRGPQGTLYGRNSTGGAVNFIARRPGNDLGANISASYGNYDAVRVDGGVDAPVGDKFAMRLSGFYEDRDGYVGHPALPAGRYGGFVFPGYKAGRSDDNHAWGGRLSFKADDIGNLSAYLALESSAREFTSQAFAALDAHQPAYNPGPTCSANGWTAVAPLITNQTLCVPTKTNGLAGLDRSYYQAPANGLGRTFTNTQAIRGRLDYDFGPQAVLSYIGGFRYFERSAKSTGSLPVVYANTTNENNNKTQSHEIRLAGVIDKFTYQVGGFYFKEVIKSLGGFYLGDVTQGSPNFGLYVNYNRRDSSNEAKSAFGQVEYAFTDALTAVGGIRYSDNKNRGYWRDKLGGFNGPAPRFEATATFTPPKLLASDQDKITWLMGLNWKPDTDTLVYGKVSTGFKAGGFDAVGTYGPETNTAYEAGFKKNVGESGQHIVNGTAFYYDYTGLQVNVLLSSAEGGRVFNAGSAKIYGAETDFKIELTENTNFTGSINYLHSELKNLNALFSVYCVPIAEGGRGTCKTATGDDLTSVGDLDPNTAGIQAPSYSGNKPGYAPKWIITAGLDHTFDLGNESTLTARINTTFKSSYFTNFYNYNDANQKKLHQTDIALDYKTGNGVELSVYGRNLENKRPLTQSYFLAAATDDILNFQFGAPRTYGARIAYEF